MSMPLVSIIRFDTALEFCAFDDVYICCFDVCGNDGVGQHDDAVSHAHGPRKTTCDHHLPCRTGACLYIGIAIDSNKRAFQGPMKGTA